MMSWSVRPHLSPGTFLADVDPSSSAVTRPENVPPVPGTQLDPAGTREVLTLHGPECDLATAGPTFDVSRSLDLRC